MTNRHGRHYCQKTGASAVQPHAGQAFPPTYSTLMLLCLINQQQQKWIYAGYHLGKKYWPRIPANLGGYSSPLFPIKKLTKNSK